MLKLLLILVLVLREDPEVTTVNSKMGAESRMCKLFVWWQDILYFVFSLLSTRYTHSASLLILENEKLMAQMSRHMIPAVLHSSQRSCHVQDTQSFSLVNVTRTCSLSFLIRASHFYASGDVSLYFYEYINQLSSLFLQPNSYFGTVLSASGPSNRREHVFHHNNAYSRYGQWDARSFESLIGRFISTISTHGN